MGFRPGIQVRAAIDDLAPKPIEGRADPFVSPLCQFFPVADQLKFGIAQDVVSVLLEYVVHLDTRSFVSTFNSMRAILSN